jgi:hypothetical protein
MNDADNDGNFETLVTPTANLTGTAASDVTPPSVNINTVRQGNTATATITAQDAGAGVNKIWYSLDGQTFDQYTSPVSIPYSANPVTIEAFADDNAANRSGLVAKTVYFNFSIGGTVTYGISPVGQPAKFVSGVSLNAVATGFSSVSTVTNNTGAYLLSNLTADKDYTVTASKTGNMSGITSFDATLVLRHVAAGGQGVNALSANQKLAADTNSDNDVSSFDATQILRFVAANGQNADTGQVGNWKFSPASRSHPSLGVNVSDADYTAFLIGEVNGDWMLPVPIVAPQSPPQVQISVPQNITATQGSIILVPIAFSNNSGAAARGYSFQVLFDPLVLKPDIEAIRHFRNSDAKLLRYRRQKRERKNGCSVVLPNQRGVGNSVEFAF